MSTTHRVLFIAALLSGSTLSCGSSTTAAAGPEVTVSNFQFAPAQLTINTGDTLTWHFTQGIHNVVSGASCASDGKFTSGDPKPASYDYAYKFTTPGTYEYYCTPHCQSQGMKATVIVQ